MAVIWATPAGLTHVYVGVLGPPTCSAVGSRPSCPPWRGPRPLRLYSDAEGQAGDDDDPDLRRATALARLSKVPEAAAAFCVIKSLTTGTGETASDFIGNSAIPVAAVLVGDVENESACRRP